MTAKMEIMKAGYPLCVVGSKPMIDFKTFHSAKATIAGIETTHIIRGPAFVRRKHSRLQAVYG
jgi:hypothetical protein